MLIKKWLKLTKYQQICIIILIVIFGFSGLAAANDFNADAILNKMSPQEQVSYVSGVVEGLAYSRFLKDRPDETGMNCIYDWYYKDSAATWERIEAWFGRHPDQRAGVLLYVLMKKECGE